MTCDELRTAMNQVIDILNRNRSLVGPFLKALNEFSAAIRNQPQTVQLMIAAFGLPATEHQVFNAVQQVVEIQNTLLEGGLTDKLINILTRVQSRGLLMHTLALLV